MKKVSTLAGSLVLASTLILMPSQVAHAFQAPVNASVAQSKPTEQALKTTVDAIQQSLAITTSQLDVANTAVAKATANVHTSDQQVADDEATITSLQSDVDANKTELAEQQAQLTKQTEFAATVDQAKLAQDKANATKFAKTVAAEKAATKQGTVKAAMKVYVADWKKLSALQDSIQHREEAQQDVKAAQDSLADSQRSLDKLNTLLQQAQTKLAQSQATAATAQQTLVTAQHQQQTLQKDYDQQQQSLHNAQTALTAESESSLKPASNQDTENTSPSTAPTDTAVTEKPTSEDNPEPILNNDHQADDQPSKEDNEPVTESDAKQSDANQAQLPQTNEHASLIASILGMITLSMGAIHLIKKH
ncbi:LPXTG cell wall anchor domain-containing protein [Lactiplantibacillus garii]|uniref:LPXTG cell wall anchor domain-containing protein n=1 Tax=Lactiplantibacillus garii TaxID=2306423 RepID=A0A426D871_9LACO|nr:LPXTG cell wall anchor domain-containing protein [Lactiplantibacillus garii]RRK10824.1 LPXTG cell wall anchor domain-containing protein [Lactiplantibacillus garii]